MENLENDEVLKKLVEEMYNDNIKFNKIKDQTSTMTLILHLKKLLADDSGDDKKKKDKGKKDVVDEAGHKGFVVVGFPLNIKQCYIYEK